ncbi:MAG: holdfast anchor protein HfaD [Oceanicaulis sp.]
MSRLARALIAGTSAATLISAASFAEPTDRVELDQQSSGPIQGQDVQAADDVEVAVSTALAQANSATGQVTNRTGVSGSQSLTGSVDAVSSVDVENAWSYVTSNASAQGNALTIGADANVDLDLDQSAAAGARVSGLSALRIASYAGHTVQGASAAANAVQVTGAGAHELQLRQSSGADVIAGAVLDAADAEIETFAQGAQAAGNSLTAGGYEGDPIADLDQSQSGTVEAVTSADVRNADFGGVAASSAAGNTVTIVNDYGYAHAQGAQTNSGPVRATTTLNIADFANGLIAGSANAVGNASLVSNIGADAYSGVAQTNSGAVTAQVNFTGGIGGSGVGGAGAALSASAIGNAQSAYICSECPVSLGASINQVNSGPVSAGVNASHTGFVNALTGSATAVGNAATFSSRTPGE